MKSALPCLALWLLFATGVSAAPRTLVLSTDGKSFAGFRIDDTIETVNGTTRQVSGKIVVDPQNLPASTVTMSIDLGSLDTGIALRDSEMRDTLEAKKYPAAVFRSVLVVGPTLLEPGKATDVKLSGDFTLHGVTRRINVPVRLLLSPDGRLQASGRFAIRMTDYDIAVPDKLIVSVANEVALRFDVTAR